MAIIAKASVPKKPRNIASAKVAIVQAIQANAFGRPSFHIIFKIDPFKIRGMFDILVSLNFFQNSNFKYNLITLMDKSM